MQWRLCRREASDNENEQLHEAGTGSSDWEKAMASATSTTRSTG